MRAEVERHHPPVCLIALRHVAGDDTLRQSLDQRRFASARLANHHRIVFGAARQNLNHAPNLLRAANHRIELAVLGQLGEVNAVFVQRFAGRTAPQRRAAAGMIRWLPLFDRIRLIAIAAAAKIATQIRRDLG
jgi:hypothetical protein